MARDFPRFLLSSPKGGKHQGPFVFHTISPVILCRIVLHNEDKSALNNFCKTRSGWTLELLKNYDEMFTMERVGEVMDEMLKWLPSQY